ncbi:MAG TPA: hypothetical protein VFJ02_19200 [Vicinamibacterales bacterium]|nr:hypothetical protein [Vicinamibacterales bacterium]
MKRARIGILAAAVFAVATLAFAQAKPDFSGSWTPEVDPAAAAGGGGGGRGMGGGPMTVKQTATDLTITREGRQGQVTTAYKLDGSETKITMGQGEATASAKWEGNKLVITTKFGENTNTQTWSLDAGVLTIERTGGRGPSTTKYKKTT